MLFWDSQKDVEDRVTPMGESRAPAGDESWWGDQQWLFN